MSVLQILLCGLFLLPLSTIAGQARLEFDGRVAGASQFTTINHDDPARIVVTYEAVTPADSIIFLDPQDPLSALIGNPTSVTTVDRAIVRIDVSFNDGPLRTVYSLNTQLVNDNKMETVDYPVQQNWPYPDQISGDVAMTGFQFVPDTSPPTPLGCGGRDTPRCDPPNDEWLTNETLLDIEGKVAISANLTLTGLGGAQYQGVTGELLSGPELPTTFDPNHVGTVWLLLGFEELLDGVDVFGNPTKLLTSAGALQIIGDRATLTPVPISDPCLPPPDDGRVTITGRTYAAGETVDCQAAVSITTGNAVTVATGADVAYAAPEIILLPGFRAEVGSVFHAGQTLPPVL